MSEKTDWTSDEFVFHWKYYEPPARASPSDLEFIRKKIIGKRKSCKVLILGSTPEYRNLLSELGMPCSLLDFSRLNYNHLSGEVKDTSREAFIEGDWINTVLDQKFDIILGDAVINVINKDSLPDFLRNIVSILEDNGLFIVRTYIRNEGERYTTEQALEEYREERQDFNIFNGTTRNLCIACYDFENDSMKLKQVYEMAEGLYDKGLISKEELKTYKDAYEGWDFAFFIPEMKYLETEFRKLFDVKEIFYGKEAYLKNKLPLYVLTKK